MGNGIYYQIVNCKKQYYTPLTLEILDDYLNELQMGKRRNKKVFVDNQKPTKEMIKSVMELFKPNKFQLYLMKLIGVNAWFTGNKNRVKLLQDILKLSPGEIYELEIEYYLETNKIPF